MKVWADLFHALEEICKNLEPLRIHCLPGGFDLLIAGEVATIDWET